MKNSKKRTRLWITKAEVLTTHRINGKYTDRNFEAIRAMRNPLTSQVNIWFTLPTSSPSKSSSSQNSCKLSYIFFHLWSICIDCVQSIFSFSTPISAAAAEPCCFFLGPKLESYHPPYPASYIFPFVLFAKQVTVLLWLGNELMVCNSDFC